MDIPDITPDHNPVKLAKVMMKKAPECVAGFYCLLTDDGGLIYDAAGIHRRDLLWALEKTRIELIKGE